MRDTDKCAYCGWDNCYYFTCPYHPYTLVVGNGTKYCEVCGDWIYQGEEYIERDDGKAMHYDCVPDTRDLIKWLGYSIKTE